MKRTILKKLIMALVLALFYLTITIQGADNENPDNFMQQNELNLNPHPFHHLDTILNIEENDRSYKIIEVFGKLKTPMLNVFVLTNSFYLLCLLSWVFVGEKNKCIFDASCPENTNYFIEHFKIFYLSWDWILYLILCLILSPLQSKITNIPIDRSIENLIKLFESKLASNRSFEFIFGLWDNNWLQYFDPLTWKWNYFEPSTLTWIQSLFFDTLEANEGTGTFRIANKLLRLQPFWTRNFKIVSKFIFSCEMKTPNKLACNRELSQLNSFENWKECWEDFFPQYFDKFFNQSLRKQMIKILTIYIAQHLLEIFSDSMDNVLPNITTFHNIIPHTSGSSFDILYIIFVEQIGLKILSEYLLFVTLPQFITNLFVFIKNLFLLGYFYDIVFTKNKYRYMMIL